MRTKRLILVAMLTVALFVFVGCSQPTEPGPGANGAETPPPASKGGTLVVGAAASLNESFTELGQLFEVANPGWKVEFTFASSGNLKTSIEQGAPIDVFASAAEKQMNGLKESGHIDISSVKLLLKNELVLIAPTGSTVDSLEDLLELDKIAVGEPESVPAGQYAKQSLTHLEYWDKLEGHLVFTKDVRQVLFYVERDEVDAGFVYATDAAKSDHVQVVMPMPEGSYPTILYPIGVLTETKNRDAADKWVEFVMGDQGQQVLSKYGFKQP